MGNINCSINLNEFEANVVDINKNFLFHILLWTGKVNCSLNRVHLNRNVSSSNTAMEGQHKS